MRINFRLIPVGAALLIAAACSEPTSMPSDQRSADLRAPRFDLIGSSSAVSQFTVTAAGGSFRAGGFTVDFPANSVCDPSVSTYGEGEWDKPCVTLGDGESVNVQATVVVGSNGIAVDFQPAIRFSPSRQVTISTDIFAAAILANREYYAQNLKALGALTMYYSPSLGAKKVADYVGDRSLSTHIDLRTGRIWRRVKHFSGVSITSGEACEPSPDNPDCVEVEGKEGGGGI